MEFKEQIEKGTSKSALFIQLTGGPGNVLLRRGRTKGRGVLLEWVSEGMRMGDWCRVGSFNMPDKRFGMSGLILDK